MTSILYEKYTYPRHKEGDTLIDITFRLVNQQTQLPIDLTDIDIIAVFREGGVRDKKFKPVTVEKVDAADGKWKIVPFNLTTRGDLIGDVRFVRDGEELRTYLELLIPTDPNTIQS